MKERPIIVNAIPSTPTERQPGEPLHDIEVAVARGWIESLRRQTPRGRYTWTDREKLARVIERLLDAAPRHGIDHIALTSKP